MKLHIKDLINIGIFTALYYVFFFMTGMLGYIPLFMVLLPIIAPLVTGIPYMLFLTKVDKFGMISIKAILLGLTTILTGHMYVAIITALVFGLLSDLAYKVGKYKSNVYAVISFMLFNLWFVGLFLPLWLMRDKYFEILKSQMGEVYANYVYMITPNWVLWVIIFATIIASYFGAVFGQKILQKHFRKAGIA